MDTSPDFEFKACGGATFFFGHDSEALVCTSICLLNDSSLYMLLLMNSQLWKSGGLDIIFSMLSVHYFLLVLI